MPLDACSAVINFYIGKAWAWLAGHFSGESEHTFWVHWFGTPKIHSVPLKHGGPARPQGFEAEGVAARRDVLCLCRGRASGGCFSPTHLQTVDHKRYVVPTSNPVCGGLRLGYSKRVSRSGFQEVSCDLFVCECRIFTASRRCR